ncbi:hypothetical protein [Cetobacterium sp.]|jgi:hypothetical protein|uniref:hypothetical protein n=1 Tax=Cetobacterium sp. TaxID=2071632 RepID=UPI003F330318
MCKEIINNKKFTEDEITEASNRAFNDLMRELDNKEYKILKAITTYNLNFNKRHEQVSVVNINMSAKFNDVKFLIELGYLQ